MLRLDPGEGRIHTTRTLQAWEGGGEYNVARGLRRCFGLRTAVVTALAVIMARRPQDLLAPRLLALAKLTSSLLSLGFILLRASYFIVLVNGVVDGIIGNIVLWLVLPPKTKVQLVLWVRDYGSGSTASQSHLGFNGTERPGAVYLAAVQAAHNQKGLPAFGIYGHDVQDAGDQTIPVDVQEKLIRFTRAALAVATLRNKSYM